jgi:uncharacterized protein (DUF1501 family)
MITTPNFARAAVALALLSLAACASTPAPTEQMAVGRKAVERASGTPEIVQWAPSELERARLKLSLAESAMNKKDYAEARRYADEAEAEAVLAEAHAHAMKNQRAVAEVRDALRSMREELARRPG